MKVKDIIAVALRFIGREEISQKLIRESTGTEAADGEETDKFAEITDNTEATDSEETADGVEENPNEEVFTEEEREVIDTLLYCFNSVEDELARCYIPLQTEELMSSETGVYNFADFKLRPVKIIAVKSNGRMVKYFLDAQHLVTDRAEITVEYGYAPLRKGLNDNSEFSSVFANERLVASGTAAEYCLIDGEAQLAETWESIYRSEIENIQRTRFSGLRLPPRRWV